MQAGRETGAGAEKEASEKETLMARHRKKRTPPRRKNGRFRARKK